MTERENKALYIAEQCRKAGMTLAGAAGVITNIEAESAFSPTNLEDSKEHRIGMTDAQYTAAVDNGTYTRFTTDQAGYGLAQWTASDRKEGMLQFHKARGKSIGDFVTQVDWMLTEMGRYRRAWLTCIESKDPYQCGYDVCKYYEICDNLEAQSQYRGTKARDWYNWLQQHQNDESSIELPQQNPAESKPVEQVKDDDGIPISVTWPPRTIDQNCSGWKEVKLLQILLWCHGYNVVIDGIFSKETLEKVIKFQGEHKLKTDGVVGPNTWRALGLNI